MGTFYSGMIVKKRSGSIAWKTLAVKPKPRACPKPRAEGGAESSESRNRSCMGGLLIALLIEAVCEFLLC
jgi:hypothetical protein